MRWCTPSGHKRLDLDYQTFISLYDTCPLLLLHLVLSDCSEPQMLCSRYKQSLINIKNKKPQLGAPLHLAQCLSTWQLPGNKQILLAAVKEIETWPTWFPAAFFLLIWLLLCCALQTTVETFKTPQTLLHHLNPAPIR